MTFTASEVASLTKTIENWELGEYVCAGLVTVGCFGEFVADFTNWFMNGGLWRALGNPDRRKDNLAKISTLVLIIALVFELVCLVKTNNLSGRIVGSLSERSEEAFTKSGKALDDSKAASTQAGQAIVEAGMAESLSAGAVDKADKASGAASNAINTVARALKDVRALEVATEKQKEFNGSVMNQLADRHVDVRLKEALKSLPVAKVEIQSLRSDEPLVFAIEIKNALSEIGWTVPPISAPPPGRTFVGVTIVNGYAVGDFFFGPPSNTRMVAPFLEPQSPGRKVDERLAILIVALKAGLLEKDVSLGNDAFRIVVGKNVFPNGFPLPLGGHLKTGHTWPPQNRPTERDQDKSIYNLTLSTSATFFAI